MSTFTGNKKMQEVIGGRRPSAAWPDNGGMDETRQRVVYRRSKDTAPTIDNRCDPNTSQPVAFYFHKSDR